MKLVILFCSVFSVGCASRVLEYDSHKADQALRNDEYESRVKVVAATPPPLPTPTPLPPQGAEPAPAPKPPPPPAHEKASKKKRKGKAATASNTTAAKKEAPAVKTPGPHEPEIEDSAGFVGRRPTKDPFRIGEKVTLSLSYFNIVAGNMDVMVKPMVEVNGEKAYHFEVYAKSSSLFNHIYGVDDRAVTYMSYTSMRPMNLQITLKESKQLAEARTLFDWDKNKASYWQKRITKEHGEESKKIEWDIKAFSQNVISAAFYIRTFQMEVGKKLAIRVADEGKNIVFKGEVLRKEKLKTEVGELDTVVIKPEITVDGVFTPVGEVLLWLTDDDRKFIARIESKIRIGTIVAKLKAIERGDETSTP